MIFLWQVEVLDQGSQDNRVFKSKIEQLNFVIILNLKTKLRDRKKRCINHKPKFE